jgi:hypothetical protein
VNRLAVRPKGVSFACVTASSYDDASSRAATGPKISSRATGLAGATSASTVGRT